MSVEDLRGPLRSGVGVTVETVLLGRVGPHLTYRSAQAGLIDGDHPDALARRLAGLDRDDAPSAALLHSTSWRFGAGGVVLTYAALPDPHPAAASRLDPRAHIAHGHDHLAPSPAVIRLENVAVHACRHLAFLRHTDPLVAALAGDLPELWTLIDSYRPAVAGLVSASSRP